MKSGLSKREKALIFIAVVFALLVIAFRFVIMPLYHNYEASMEEYDRLSAEQVLMELKIQNEVAARTGYENAESSFKELQKRYPTVMPNEEVDRILTGLCLQNHLNPVMLGMSGLSDYVIVEEPSEDSESESESEEAPPTVQGPAAFSVLKATMNLNGDYESLKNLITTVEKIEYIRISWISFARNSSMGSSGSSNISVLFEVTMMNEMPENIQ